MKKIEEAAERTGYTTTTEESCFLAGARYVLDAMTSDAMTEIVARALWECSDDEVGWDATIGLANIGDLFLKSQVDWYRDQARTALAAVRKEIKDE